MRQGSRRGRCRRKRRGAIEPDQADDACAGRGVVLKNVSGRNWLSEPKAAIWIALAAALLIGGGRRLLLAWRARKAVVLPR